MKCTSSNLLKIFLLRDYVPLHLELLMLLVINGNGVAMIALNLKPAINPSKLIGTHFLPALNAIPFICSTQALNLKQRSDQGCSQVMLQLTCINLSVISPSRTR